MSNYTLFTKKEDVHKRLDQFLKEQIPELSRNLLRSIIQSGDVKVGFKAITDIAYSLENNKKIIVTYKKEKKYGKPKPENSRFPIQIVHEDRDIIVIDKKAGVLSSPTRKKEKDTALHLINGYIKQKYHIKFHTTFIVHLLDQATSGLIVYAKNSEAQEILKKQFEDNTSKQVYEAIIQGTPLKEKGTLQSFLASKYNKVSEVESEEFGEMAITHYKVIKKIGNGATYIEIKPETHKKNQIRFQFSKIGLPLVGDKKYNEIKKSSFKIPRLALHLTRLEFKHPKTEKKMVFNSPFPSILKKFVSN